MHCGKVSLEALADRFGTPLYVYSADQIVERLGLFQQAFEVGSTWSVMRSRPTRRWPFSSCWQSAGPASILSPAANWSGFRRPRRRQ